MSCFWHGAWQGLSFASSTISHTTNSNKSDLLTKQHTSLLNTILLAVQRKLCIKQCVPCDKRQEMLLSAWKFSVRSIIANASIDGKQF